MRINGLSGGNGRYWTACGGLIAVAIASSGEVACSALATNCGESRTCPSSNGGQAGQSGQGGTDDGGPTISEGNGGRNAGSGGQPSTGGEVSSGRHETDGGAGNAADAKTPSVPIEAGTVGDASSRTRGCPEGFADCNADPEDGCEVELG